MPEIDSQAWLELRHSQHKIWLKNARTKEKREYHLAQCRKYWKKLEELKGDKTI